MYLRGAALREGFSPEAAQALTRFLSERVQLPAIELPYEFPADFVPQRVDVEREDTEKKQPTILTTRELLDLVEYLGMVRGAEENSVIVCLIEKLEQMREEAFRAGRGITRE